MVLVGDIGGTKTDLAIYASGSNPNSPVARKQFQSADYASLQAIVTEFLTDVKAPVNQATFDVAGPVIDKSVITTNLPWVMDEDSLAIDLNLKSVHLMNDLEAVARAIPILRANDVVTLNVGSVLELVCPNARRLGERLRGPSVATSSISGLALRSASLRNSKHIRTRARPRQFDK